MLFSFGTGVFLWLIYGMYVHAVPVVAANLVTLALVLVLIVLKVRYRTGE
jgi:MtN3 and saliva related transmembrane protein